jgi:hypothetical protein
MQDDKYVKAQIRVRKLRNFYEVLITYFVINILLIIVNFVFSPNHIWFYWVTVFSGIVIIIQVINLFTIRDRMIGENWEQKKIKEIMDKDTSP